MAFRILITEDDPLVQSLLRAILVKMGYLVDTCRDGATADRLLQENEYTLLVIDLDVPLLDGSEVIRNLSERGLEIPVILLADEFARDDSLPPEWGSIICIEKPFGIDELCKAVRKLLAR